MLPSHLPHDRSKNLHFVDAEDDPMDGSCSVHELRDCGNQVCILAAIANYTTRLVDKSLPATETQIALKFIDHFIGDISQPLHVEAVAAGGNGISVTCAGKKTNLHAIWDTNMLELNLDAEFGGSVQSYVNSLVSRIQDDDFSVPVSQWLSCTSTTEPFTVVDPSKRMLRDLARHPDVARDVRAATITPLACPLVWARESNGFDCTTVFTFRNGTDVCNTGNYLANAIPVIDLQLARSGLRLATWLNELLDP